MTTGQQRVRSAVLVFLAVGLTVSSRGVSGLPEASAAAQAGGGQPDANVASFRTTIEPLLLKPRGGTSPGYAACVMCHTWQTRPIRFSLETPATDVGWTEAQSPRNVEVVTKLVNTADPGQSRLLLKPLAASAGGLAHTGGTYWSSRDDPEYQTVLAWIRSLPPGRYVPAQEPTVDFTFFRSCVQRVFQTPRDGHIRCSNCHDAGLIGFAPVPGEGRAAWNDEEARRAFQVISRLIVPGNPEQSRFMLKPLHPDGGGSYAHNGVRRWQSRDDPEWQMLAAWIRGQRTGGSCS